MNMQKLDEFHKTRWGYLAFGLVELLMAYGFVDWALDTGALWWWAAAFVLILGGLHNLALAAWRRKQ